MTLIEPIRISFALAGRPPSPNALRAGPLHWGPRAKEYERLRQAAYLTALDAVRRSGRADSFPLRRAALELVYVLEAARGDLDNLVAGSKPIVDGISRGLGASGERGPVLYSDAVGYLEELHVRWRRGRTAGVEIYVREVI